MNSTSPKLTYVLFQSVDQNVSCVGPRRSALTSFRRTLDDVARLMLEFAHDACDNNIISEDGKTLSCCDGSLMMLGDMSYSHDGRNYWVVQLSDMDENEAAMAIRSGVLCSTDTDEVYKQHPNLASEQDEN